MKRALLFILGGTLAAFLILGCLLELMTFFWLIPQLPTK